MKRLCAWCTRPLGDPAPGTDADRGISHGICDECIGNILLQQGADLFALLDSLEAPIAMVDEGHAVHALNRAAAELLGMDRDTCTGRAFGLVFECEHARKPEGCGRTIHCSGCAIRRAIQTTVATGQGVTRQPATLRWEDGSVSLLVTTEKAGSMILVRIDQALPRDEP